MDAKRGQITIFIIIGLVIIIILGIVLYIRTSSNQSTNQDAVLDTSSVNNLLTSCAKMTAQDAVIYVGLRGGDIFSEKYATFLAINVPYYYYEGVDLSPSDQVITDSLKFYMDSALKTCTNGFQSFKDQGYTIEEGEVNSTVTIADEDVIFDINYPITVVKGETRDVISGSSASVKVNLFKMAKAARDYVVAQKDEPNAFRLKHLMDIASAADLKFEVFDREEGKVVISLVDESIKIKDNPYVFTFAIKYAWQD